MGALPLIVRVALNGAALVALVLLCAFGVKEGTRVSECATRCSRQEEAHRLLLNQSVCNATHLYGKDVLAACDKARREVNVTNLACALALYWDESEVRRLYDVYAQDRLMLLALACVTIWVVVNGFFSYWQTRGVMRQLVRHAHSAPPTMMATGKPRVEILDDGGENDDNGRVRFLAAPPTPRLALDAFVYDGDGGNVEIPKPGVVSGNGDDSGDDDDGEDDNGEVVKYRRVPAKRQRQRTRAQRVTAITAARGRPAIELARAPRAL